MCPTRTQIQLALLLFPEQKAGQYLQKPARQMAECIGTGRLFSKKEIVSEHDCHDHIDSYACEKINRAKEKNKTKEGSYL